MVALKTHVLFLSQFMRIHSSSIFILFFVAKSFFVQAQQNYPQHYFRDPLNIPIQLASNFGELRPDHFHMGLDIRTQSRENLPVFAVADGYISHIKIEKYGYGRAIYIKHPNGYTTVYGHLNSFYDALEKYLENKQYTDGKWEQDFDLPANMFAVSKGQFIANSGNTGGSQGPHLHFEIRDTKTGNNLNPLLFGLNVSDNIAPSIYGLYWYDRRYSIYSLSPQPISIIQKNNAYTTKNGVAKVGSPIITLGIRMKDKSNISPFHYGVYRAALYMDDTLLFEFKLNNFSYYDSRYVNACMDYKRWMENKQGIQYLSILPGNKLNVFTPLASDGKVVLYDTSIHKIKIEINDEQQNTSTLNFLIQYDGALQKNYSLPVNAIVCDVNEVNDLETKNSKIHFDESAFYDALPLTVYETPSTTTKQISSTIHIGNYSIPVQDDYTVSIKTDKILDDELKDKTVMQLISGNSKIFVKGEWQNNYMLGSFDELGDAALLIDTIAPVIIPVEWKDGTVFKTQKNLIIKCKDDLSKIVNFTATLDGNWLMFAKKNDNFIYTFDAHCATGNHTLTITITDVAGNAATQTFNFTKQ
ncbi:MAG: peptidoglycan DD-metalloendopeptidase family protein [Parafilimonas sp.]